MANIDINSIFQTLKGQVISLATETFSNYKNQAKADAEDFLKSSEDNIKRWTLELANNELSKDEFESLIKGQADLLKMEALKQAGIAQIELNKLTNGILNIVIETIFKYIP